MIESVMLSEGEERLKMPPIINTHTFECMCKNCVNFD